MATFVLIMVGVMAIASFFVLVTCAGDMIFYRFSFYEAFFEDGR